jgi:hypothetical protein
MTAKYLQSLQMSQMSLMRERSTSMKSGSIGFKMEIFYSKLRIGIIGGSKKMSYKSLDRSRTLKACRSIKSA